MRGVLREPADWILAVRPLKPRWACPLDNSSSDGGRGKDGRGGRGGGSGGSAGESRAGDSIRGGHTLLEETGSMDHVGGSSRAGRELRSVQYSMQYRIGPFQLRCPSLVADALEPIKDAPETGDRSELGQDPRRVDDRPVQRRGRALTGLALRRWACSTIPYLPAFLVGQLGAWVGAWDEEEGGDEAAAWDEEEGGDDSVLAIAAAGGESGQEGPLDLIDPEEAAAEAVQAASSSSSRSLRVRGGRGGAVPRSSRSAASGYRSATKSSSDDPAADWELPPQPKIKELHAELQRTGAPCLSGFSIQVCRGGGYSRGCIGWAGGVACGTAAHGSTLPLGLLHTGM